MFGRLLRISWTLGPIDVQTEMRTELELIKKRNLEYLQVKDRIFHGSVSLFRAASEKNLKVVIFTFVRGLPFSNKLVLLLFII